MKYEIIKDNLFGDIICKNNEDGSKSYIPSDPANSDYQEYLKSINN